MRSPFLAACLLNLVSCMATPVQGPMFEPAQELCRGASELQRAFNAHLSEPRLVVLVPPSCERTRTAMAEIRAEIERLAIEKPVTWLIIWQDDLPEDNAQTAAQASAGLGWDRTLYFHDGYGAASRQLARGTVLSGTLGRAFLYYPAGLAWNENPPEPAAWVHCMGRLTPEHAQPPERMAQAITSRWVELEE
jgi:hypothetical protein